MWPLKFEHLQENEALFWGLSTHIYWISLEIDWKSFICWVKLGMWTFKLIVLEYQALFSGL